MVECEQCSCEDVRKIVKEIVNEIFNERLVKLTTEMKTKKKRQPSAYNIYMGNCVKSGGDFRSCAEKYKQQKGKPVKPSDNELAGLLGNL